jgi:hypothetical protein
MEYLHEKGLSMGSCHGFRKVRILLNYLEGMPSSKEEPPCGWLTLEEDAS